MPGLSSILAAASALPGIFGIAKDLFGGGGDNTGGSTGYASVDPQAQKFNQYMMNYMQEKLQQPHQFRPVPEMPYNVMNMVSQAYGMGPYKDPGWQQAGGGPGAMGGMPQPQGSKRQLQAPDGGGTLRNAGKAMGGIPGLVAGGGNPLALLGGLPGMLLG